MSNFEFFLSFLEYWPRYVGALLLSVLLHYILFKRSINSILDPFFYEVFGMVFASAIPFFLLFTNAISPKFFIHFILCHLFFLVGFKIIPTWSVFRPKPTQKIRSRYLFGFSNEFYFMYYLSLVVLVISQIIAFKLNGVPLFAESRLEVFQIGGGIGSLVQRLVDFLLLLNPILLMLVIANTKSIRLTPLHIANIAIVVIFLALTGSKGAILSIGFIFYMVATVLSYQNNDLLIKVFPKIKKIMGVIFFVFIAVVINSRQEGPDSKFFQIGSRLVMYGDAYYMSYGNNVIEALPSANPIIAAFASPLSLFALVPKAMVPPPLGFSIMEITEPYSNLAGPNPRLHVFAYVYFGYLGALLFCFIVGFAMSFVRNLLYRLSSGTANEAVFYILLVLASVKMMTDYYLAWTYILNALFFFPVFVLISKIIYGSVVSLSSVENGK